MSELAESVLDGLPYEKRIEISENINRKEFTESEKADIAKLITPLLKKQSKQGSRNQPKRSKHETSIKAKIGAILGESEDTVRKRAKVFEKIDAKTKKELDSGRTSLNKEYKKIIVEENTNRPSEPLPSGKFTDIIEDPGWEFDNKNIGGSGESGASFHYKTQPTNQIARIPVNTIAADNAVLYMYTTNQHLIKGTMLMSEFYEIINNQKMQVLSKKITNKEKIKKMQEEMQKNNKLLSDIWKNQKVQSDALAVMHCHGFEPKCIVTWEKDEKNGWGGYWLNNTTEQLLIGIRGNVPAFNMQEKTIIKSKYIPKNHSKKPKVAWQLIEKCVAAVKGKHRKLEMNCREPRKGWYPHGNEITPDDLQKWQKLKL